MGEASLAHWGMLFLNELPEIGQHTPKVLQQPLEDKGVTIDQPEEGEVVTKFAQVKLWKELQAVDHLHHPDCRHKLEQQPPTQQSWCHWAQGQGLLPELSWKVYITELWQTHNFWQIRDSFPWALHP